VSGTQDSGLSGLWSFEDEEKWLERCNTLHVVKERSIKVVEGDLVSNAISNIEDTGCGVGAGVIL
jgi:hypothetical protein